MNDTESKLRALAIAPEFEGTTTAALMIEAAGEIAKLLEERSKFDASHDWDEAMRENTKLREALAPLVEIARIRKLYEGPPCENERHPDDAYICFVEHGRESVTLSLGQCRAAAKLLGHDF